MPEAQSTQQNRAQHLHLAHPWHFHAENPGHGRRELSSSASLQSPGFSCASPSLFQQTHCDSAGASGTQLSSTLCVAVSAQVPFVLNMRGRIIIAGFAGKWNVIHGSLVKDARGETRERLVYDRLLFLLFGFASCFKSLKKGRCNMAKPHWIHCWTSAGSSGLRQIKCRL